MKSALPLILLGFSLLPAVTIHAANRFWVSSAASNWNNSANWSNRSGGPGGFSVPSAGDNVTFDNAFFGNCTIDIPINIRSITVDGGYSGSIVQGSNTILVTRDASFSGGIFIGGNGGITVNGDFNLSGTAFTSTSGILEFDGNADFNGGVFGHNNGSVKFNALGGTSAITGNSPAFFILEFVGSGSNYNINSNGNIIVLNSLNLTGNLFYNLNAGTIDIRGNISVTNTATGCSGSALININGTVNQNFNGSSAAGSGALPRLTINKSSGTLNLSNFPASSNDFTYTAGTVNAGSSTYCFVNGTTTPYSVSGNLALNNVEFLALANQTYTIAASTTLTVNGNLVMAGTNQITLNTGNINANGNIILTNTSGAGGGTANINIVGTGNVTLDGTAVAINQNVLPFINISKSGGTLTLKGIVSVSRSWTYSSGLVDASSFASTVAFGGNNLNISSNGMSFHNLTVRANTITLLNNLSLNNALVIAGGSLAPGANQVSVAGNWTDYGTAGFTEATSTVNFNGSALQTIASPGGENFVNLSINNTGPGIQLNNNATVSTTFAMTHGNIKLNGNILTLGLSAANNGSLNYTAGVLYGSGSFTRWFKTGVIPDGSVNGLFPMGTATNYRPFFISAPVAGPTAGGTVTVVYNDATTNTYTPTYPDGSFTIMVRKDLNWAVSTANGLTGGTYNLDVQGTGFGLIGAVSDLRLTLANSVVGSPGVNAGSTTNPQINRTALSRANLASTFFVGSVNIVSTPLPITLISFKASVSNKQVLLDWSTTAEINNDYFTIQRSKDREQWEFVETIDGGGTISIDKSYQATDASPYTGVSYYRLKQTDIDGKSSYSNIVTVKFADLNSVIQVFPNPSRDFISIKFPEYGKYEIALRSNSGQLMDNPVTVVGTDIRLNVSKIRTGVYLLQISHEGQIEARKIMIGK